MKRVLAVIGLVLAWLLAGCAALPELPPQPETRALHEWAATPLGALPLKTAAEGSPALSGFGLLPGGADSFDTRIALARAAQKTIDAQYYVLRNDASGRAFLRALRDAALRGVRVRLLVDDLYTAGEEDLLRDFGATPNVELKLFNPIPARGIGLLSRNLLSLTSVQRIGRRMHNKLFIADNAASVSGGRNVADVYFMRQSQSNFLDLDVLAVGPVVREQSAVFDRFWNSRHVYPAGVLIGVPPDPAAARAAFERVTAPDAAVVASPVPDLLDALRSGRRPLVWAPASVLADDPNKAVGSGYAKPGETALGGSIAAVETAQREVFLISPYFVPGKRGMAVVERLRQRGVRLVVVTNSLAATDETLVFGAYARYRVPLLLRGVEISELSPGRAQKRGHFSELGRSTAMLHAKFAIIDQRAVVIGSMNLDPRSADINTEIGLRIDSPELAAQLVNRLDEDRFESAYRLRLHTTAEGGPAIQWVATEDGVETVLDEEPEAGALRRWLLFISSPWVPEDLL